MNGGKKNRIRFYMGGARFTVDLPEQAQGVTMGMSSWLPFSVWELRIVRLVFEAGPISRDGIAARLGESPDGKLKSSLTTLSERFVVINLPDGYVLNLAPEAREAVKKWLDGLEEPTEES